MEGGAKTSGDGLRGSKAAKFQYIADYCGSLTRSHPCPLMGVTERGLRAWKPRPPSHRQRRDMVLLAHIRNQHRLNLGSYGRPRMTEELNAVAHALNTRPRKTLGWRTPVEAFDQVLKDDIIAGVATTG